MNSNETKKDDVSKCKLARFGNKKVIKYSDEYHHQRIKNNESVKNSRTKAKYKKQRINSVGLSAAVRANDGCELLVEWPQKFLASITFEILSGDSPNKQMYLRCTLL